MDEPRELVRLNIIAVVDNEIDGMTTGCKACSCTGSEDDVGVASYTSNFNTLLARDQSLDTSRMCVAAHGLSLFLEAEFEDDEGALEQRYILFDAGPEPAVWRNNAERLGLPLANVEAIVLSHYHIDHSGGLLAAVPDIVEARKLKFQSEKKGQTPPLIVDLHKSKIVERAFKTSTDGEMIPLLPHNPTVDELETLGAQISLESEPHTLCDGCFFVSGEIPRKTAYETGMPNHFSKNDAGEWVEDTQILDERYLACRIKGRGMVVFSACSHAGIVNVLNHVKEVFKTPLTAVFGGFHLSGSAHEARIDATVRDLRQFEPELLVVGHCTGWKAKARLQRTFEHVYQPLSVGGTYTINASSKKRAGRAAAAAANKKLRKERSEPTRAEGVPKRGRLEYFKGEEGTIMRLEGNHVSGSSADKKSCVMCYYEVMRKGVIARQPAKSNNFCKTCGVYLCRSAFSGQQKSCFDKFHSQRDIERVKRDVVQPKAKRGRTDEDFDVDKDSDYEEQHVKVEEAAAVPVEPAVAEVDKEVKDKVEPKKAEEEKEDSKPEAKEDPKPEETKEEAKEEAKEESKEDSKPEAKAAEAEADAKADGKGEAKADGKSKADGKAKAAEAKGDGKPESKDGKDKDKEDDDEEDDKKKSQRPRRAKTQIMSV